jgi:hypothetical protein
MLAQRIQRAAPDREAFRDVLMVILGQQAAAVAAATARLDLADHLSERPRAVVELASLTHTSPTGLFRLLRAAAALGLVDQLDETTFAGNARTDCLRRGGSLRDIALAAADSSSSRLLESLPDAIAMGRSVAEPVLGTDVWSYRDAHPQARMALTDRLVDLDDALVPAVRDHVDLASVRCIVSIGGGTGRLLASLLRLAPAARGVLFDRPHIAATSRRDLASLGMAERIQAVGGDFLEKVPEGGDLYVLKGVLHDLDDDSACWLLDSCYMAAAPRSRLLAIEPVIADGIEPDPVTQLFDINALVTAGRERRIVEVEELFNSSGYLLEAAVPLAAMGIKQAALLVGRRS